MKTNGNAKVVGVSVVPGAQIVTVQKSIANVQKDVSGNNEVLFQFCC